MRHEYPQHFLTVHLKIIEMVDFIMYSMTIKKILIPRTG